MTPTVGSIHYNVMSCHVMSCHIMSSFLPALEHLSHVRDDPLDLLGIVVNAADAPAGQATESTSTSIFRHGSAALGAQPAHGGVSTCP